MKVHNVAFRTITPNFVGTFAAKFHGSTYTIASRVRSITIYMGSYQQCMNTFATLLQWIEDFLVFP